MPAAASRLAARKPATTRSSSPAAFRRAPARAPGPPALLLRPEAHARATAAAWGL